MRSFLLASIAALAFPACTQDITGGGGPGDDQQNPTCGNGVMDTGETCDDGNTNNGDGCSSQCTTEDTSQPRVAVTPDVTATAAVDLGGDGASVALTLTSMMGYTGPVTVTAAALDSTNAPMSDWMLTVDTPSVSLTADGTATAHVSIKAGGDVAMLTGKVKITATFGAMSSDASVDVTFNPVFSVHYTATGQTCKLPTDGTTAAPYKVKVGRQIAVYNNGGGLPFIIHGPNSNGFNHEAQGGPGTPDGQAYMSNAITGVAGDTFQFYCHGGAAGSFLQDSGTRNTVEVIP